MKEDQKNLSITISLERTLNLGNYNSAKVFISLGGITKDTTEEEMDELLDGQGALAYSKVKTALAAKVKANGLE